MGVAIQEDMWQAAEQLPDNQGVEYIYALVRYGFTGEEPQEPSPWLPLFTVSKARVSMSKSSSEKGRRMAEARWSKHNARAECTSIMHEQDAKERRGEVRRDKYKEPKVVDIDE